MTGQSLGRKRDRASFLGDIAIGNELGRRAPWHLVSNLKHLIIFILDDDEGWPCVRSPLLLRAATAASTAILILQAHGWRNEDEVQTF
jgi:hypothetical protein